MFGRYEVFSATKISRVNRDVLQRENSHAPAPPRRETWSENLKESPFSKASEAFRPFDLLLCKSVQLYTFQLAGAGDRSVLLCQKEAFLFDLPEMASFAAEQFDELCSLLLCSHLAGDLDDDELLLAVVRFG